LSSFASDSQLGMTMADEAVSQLTSCSMQCVGSSGSGQSTASDCTSDMYPSMSQSYMGSLLGHMSGICLGTQPSVCSGSAISDDCTLEASTSSCTPFDQALKTLQGLNLRHLKLNGE
jgi:hypothetical protein